VKDEACQEMVVITLGKDHVILKLNEIWDCDIPFGWIPISGNRAIPDTEMYQQFHFDAAVSNLSGMIKNIYEVTELYEIQEGGLATLKDARDCGFSYDGLEYMYTDKDFRFVLYFSHECSVTVGGKELIEGIRQAWPDYKQHFWIYD